MSGIYVASRASVPERPMMWRGLRLAGWPIVSTWIDEAGEGETEDLGELWERIETEIRSSVGVLLYAESADFPLKGALIECGIAIGMGKPVAIVLPNVTLHPRSMKPVGSWAKHPNVKICESLAAARDWLLSCAPRTLSSVNSSPVLDKPAKVGGTRFSKGVKWSTVIGAAQRHYEYEVTPEKEALRIERAREVLASIQRGDYSAVDAVASPSALTEQQKADRDLLLYGESFMLDGKHIPVERVTVRRTPKAPDFSGVPKGDA